MRNLAPLALAAVMAAPLAAPALAEEAGRITVTGEATVMAAPDIATISLGVTTTGETATEALRANNAALSAVLDRLTAAGIAAKDIQTSSLSINPNFSDYTSSQRGKIEGYTAANVVTATVRDISKLGEVLDEAVADGANTLNGLSFGLADPKPQLDAARKLAVADAVARAQLLTGAAGVGTGRIVSITEGGGYQQPGPMLRMAADSVPVAEGQTGVTAQVSIVFEIAD